jgi:nitrite reductase/ring-hydroxylating ferredoxin subunit
MAWKDAASIDDAGAARTWLPVTVDDVDIVIARTGDGWVAVEDRCTHAGCAFSEDADLHGFEIVCNCHGSEFDIRTGEVRRGPAERPVRTFPVRVADGRLEVDL